MSIAANRTADALGTYHPAIALGAIRPSKTNPRKHFDAADLAELAASIKEKGVIQPIVVRKIGGGGIGADEFEIVAGERRYRASKIAGVPTIPAIERDLDDKAVLEIQVIENLQREDVHELEEAQGYQRLMKVAHYDAKLIAEKVGKSPEYVYGRLKLLNLIEPLQGKFLAGEITAGHAILFARLPEESQIAAAKRLYDTDYNHGKQESHVISVRELANWIQSEIQMDLSKALFDTKDQGLVPAAGACGGCRKRTGAEPELWPEVKKGDFCTDNACFQKKINAHIKREVDAGNMVRLTSSWGDKKKTGFYYEGDVKEVKKDSCESAYLGVYTDGYHRGTTKYICISPTCKTHSGKNFNSGYERRITTPTEQFNNAKTAIAQTVDAEHRRRLLDAVLPKLETAAMTLPKIATTPVLLMVLKLVYSRLDSSVCAALTDELKLKKPQYRQSADASALTEYAKKLDPGRLMALITRMGLKGYAMGHLPGEWNQDKTAATKQLSELVKEFGVKLDPIAKDIETLKKEKLAKAKARLDAAKKSKGKKKLQTSAKSKSAAAVPDDDAEGDYDDPMEGDE